MKKPSFSLTAAEIFVYGFVFCIVAAIVYLGFIRGKINSNQVETIILKTTAYETVYDCVELDNDEIKQFVKLYNHSMYAGKVVAEPADFSYSVRIVFQDGSVIALRDYHGAKIHVDTGPDHPHWIKNEKLYQYIQDLIQKHNMARE